MTVMDVRPATAEKERTPESQDVEALRPLFGAHGGGCRRAGYHPGVVWPGR